MTSTIPKIDLAASSPRFAAALRKEHQLAEHLAKIDARFAGIQESLCALSHSTDDRASAMLSASDLDSIASGGEASLRDELARLEGDRRTTLRAIGMARSETAQARGEASAKVCRELLPEYRARVDALAKAMLGVHRAHAEMDALTNELDRAGAGWTGQLRPMPIKFFREVGFSDPLPAWIREARLHRLTDVELPEGWVRAWNKPPPVEEALDHDGDSMSIVKFFRKRVW